MLNLDSVILTFDLFSGEDLNVFSRNIDSNNLQSFSQYYTFILNMYRAETISRLRVN